jgi:replicative DNA helicase Mcm
MSTNDALHDKVEPDRKLRLFIEVFHALAAGYRDDVKKEALVQELVMTDKFTEQEALVYIKKAERNGFIFERSADIYALS